MTHETIGGLEANIERINDDSKVIIFVHGIPGSKDVGQIRDASAAITRQGLASTLAYSFERDEKAEHSKDSFLVQEY